MTAYTSALFVLCCVVPIIAGGVAWWWIHRAPVGYEDADGYHEGER